jgi:hypothetical protein
MILQPRRDPRRIQIAEHHREIAALAGGFCRQREPAGAHGLEPGPLG